MFLWEWGGTYVVEGGCHMIQLCILFITFNIVQLLQLSTIVNSSSVST